MKHIGWIHPFVFLIVFTVHLSSANRIKRQFPFLLGDETTELVSKPHSTSLATQLSGTTSATDALGVGVHTSKPESATRSSSLSQTIPTSTITSPVTSSTSTSYKPTLTSSGISPTSTSGAIDSSSSKSSSTWRIIGIAVICITVVGAIFLFVTFFDQWSGFLRDVVCGKKREGMGSEEFMPEKNDWAHAIQQARMSNIRYPAQILSPPLAALPLKRAVSRPVRASFMQRFSNQPHGHYFQQISARNSEPTRGLGLGLASPMNVHPRIRVGELYPTVNMTPPVTMFARQ